MTELPLPVVDIQFYASGSAPLALPGHISHAGLRCRVLSDLSEARPGLPLLFTYSDPLEAIRANGHLSYSAVVGELLERLPDLQAAGILCRLVNVSCVSVPTLVTWCVDPTSPITEQIQPRFAAPDPFDALLALEWLKEHPGYLQAYQELESHPLAAALDQRLPDVDCLVRYQQAASLDTLLLARQERAALEGDLADLAEQLKPLRDQQLEALALREHLDLLQVRLHQADAMEARCSELQLSLQAQQLDLEQLARRLALFEELVGAGSHASLRLQERLAQAIGR